MHLCPPPSPGQNKPVSKFPEQRLGRGPSEAKRGWCAQRALRAGCGSPGAAQRCPAGHRAPGSTGRHPGLTPFWQTPGSPFPMHPSQQSSSPACFLEEGRREIRLRRCLRQPDVAEPAARPRACHSASPANLGHVGFRAERGRALAVGKAVDFHAGGPKLAAHFLTGFWG